MAAKEISRGSSLTHIPKRELDAILHYLLVNESPYSKKPKVPLSFRPGHRHPFFLYQYHKNFRLVCRLRGSALCLLQTQFAKKPKNPV